SGVDLTFEKIEHVAYRDERLQLFRAEANAETAFNLRDNADDIDRIEAEFLAQLFAVFEGLKRLAEVGFEQFEDRLANGVASHHVITLLTIPCGGKLLTCLGN